MNRLFDVLPEALTQGTFTTFRIDFDKPNFETQLYRQDHNRFNTLIEVWSSRRD